MTIKGKSDKLAFKVSVDQETLLGFLATVLDKSNLEYDDDLATSPGGLPTAIFTSIVPASAREAVGWDLMPVDRYEGQERLLALETDLADIESKYVENEKAEIQAEVLLLRNAPHGKKVIGTSPLYGWDTAKAIAAFDYRLERRAGGGFSIESRQAAWDKKVADMKADGLTPDIIAKYAGKRPEAKA